MNDWIQDNSFVVIVGLAVAFTLVNGFTPYLGIKYQYSFAMLSNLI